MSDWRCPHCTASHPVVLGPFDDHRCPVCAPAEALCDVCDGDGEVVNVGLSHYLESIRFSPCPACRGTGQVHDA